MSRTISRTSADGEGHGGDRPWVYFMVDSFFLVTQFFVLTFNVRVDETILPQRMPVGCAGLDTPPVILKNHTIHIHVSNGAPRSGVALRPDGSSQKLYAGRFEMQQETGDARWLLERLSGAVSAGGPDLTVRVSYDPGTHFMHVMEVYNACAKVKIKTCGLVPLRVAAH